MLGLRCLRTSRSPLFLFGRALPARPALPRFRPPNQHPPDSTNLPPTPSSPFHSYTTYTPTAPLLQKPLPPRPPPPPECEIEEFFLKGSGPGGQKINKTSSAVQLRHTPTGLVVKSQATRSRTQNRKIARQLLANELDKLRNGDRARSAVVGLAKLKRSISAHKKSRRKYRKLGEEKRERERERKREKEGAGKGGAGEPREPQVQKAE